LGLKNHLSILKLPEYWKGKILLWKESYMNRIPVFLLQPVCFYQRYDKIRHRQLFTVPVIMFWVSGLKHTSILFSIWLKKDLLCWPMTQSDKGSVCNTLIRKRENQPLEAQHRNILMPGYKLCLQVPPWPIIS